MNEDALKKRHDARGLALVVALLTVAVYLPALGNGFVNWDDDVYVYANEYIRSLDGRFFHWAFTTFYAANWHPLTWISHAVDYALWGLDPRGHHLTGIVLHGLNTFLVVLLAAKLLTVFRERSGAAFPDERSTLIAAGVTGLLFGIHPLHVESVAWVSERKDLLCGFFYLLGLLAYADFARDPGKGGRHAYVQRPYLLALLYFALALLSKPMAVSLPVVLLILDWHPFGRLSSRKELRGAVVEKLPFVFLSAASAIVTVMAQRSSDAMKMLAAVPLWARLLVAARAVFSYLGRMVLPTGLSPYYPYPEKFEVLQSLTSYVLAILAVIVVTVAFAVIARQRKMWFAAWLSYLVALLPVIGIVQVGLQSMADRYTYLPSLGPFLVTGVVFAWCGNRSISRMELRSLRWGLPAVAAVIIAVLSVLTVRQISVWKNDVGLWSYVIEQDPAGVPMAYATRGLAFESHGDLARALQDFDRVIALRPAPYLLALAQDNRRRIAAEKEEIDRAEEEFRRATGRGSADGTAYRMLGIAYGRNGQNGRAIEALGKAIALDPQDADAYNARGLVYIAAGYYDRALADLDRAIALDPVDVDAYLNRGVAYERQGRLHRALGDYDRAVALAPRDYLAYSNRGAVFGNLGQLDRAIADQTAALALNPRFAKAYLDRARLYRLQGHIDRAAGDFEKACELGEAAGCEEMRGPPGR